jgi:hypothetical protein
MLTIKRTCANKIISHALRYESRPLFAVLPLNAEDCEICDTIEQLQQRLKQDSKIAIVYNQHADAINQVMSIDTPVDQLFVEIRQDTKGVLGLHASYKNSDKLGTLELLN